MYSLEEFNNQAINADFQRNNMFSCVFATTPSTKSSSLISSIGSFAYNNLGLDSDWLGLTQGDINQGVTTLITAGTQKLIRKSGVSKYLIGAMSQRTVQSLLGEFTVGSYLIDFFNMAYNNTGLMIYSVKMPENRLSYETDFNYNSPNIRITGREMDPLVISFRMDSEASNFRAMQDWVNSVQDPVTGLRALPQDVEADIQVNLHARNGLPHTAVMFTGCIPVSVSSPELTYDGDNQITVFDVTFAYRVMQSGAVNRQAALEWLESGLISSVSGMFGNNQNDSGLGSAVSRLSRLGGTAGGVSNINTLTGVVNSTSRVLGL
ncbi:baseplate subunit [Escherichia phage vB_EcoM_SQ17]|nr:baseplate subunit [Escherichia phage vB_EcoM_SQ17]